MTTSIYAKKVRSTPGAETRPALLSLLEARSVAVVGASARPDSFGARMLAEAAKSRSEPTIYPVNPKYREISGLTCYPALADLPGPADLVLLGVPDAALEQQLALAAQTGSGSAVIFGNAHEASAAGQGSLRERLAAIARSAGMELCGAGCMGFANVGYGLRAMGYVEPDPLPAGPVALVTHSGSVFSTLLRTRRAFGFTLAVSSGQELVTAAPSYLEYALTQPETKVLALVLEAVRQFGQRPGDGRRSLGRARGIGRRLGGPDPCLRRAPGIRPGRDVRHLGAVLAAPSGRANRRARTWHRNGPRCRTGESPRGRRRRRTRRAVRGNLRADQVEARRPPRPG